MTKVKWNSKKDNPQTFKNGWGIFLDDDKYTLHGLDDPHAVCEDHEIKCHRTFEGKDRDRNAAAFVQKKANQGDPICRKAIKFLIEQNSPDIAEFCLYLKMQFDVTLNGYNGETDETDHLVKWIRTPSREMLGQWIDFIGLRPYVQSIDEVHEGEDLTFADGIDVLLDTVQHREDERDGAIYFVPINPELWQITRSQFDVSNWIAESRAIK